MFSFQVSEQMSAIGSTWMLDRLREENTQGYNVFIFRPCDYKVSSTVQVQI